MEEFFGFQTYHLHLHFDDLGIDNRSINFKLMKVAARSMASGFLFAYGLICNHYFNLASSFHYRPIHTKLNCNGCWKNTNRQLISIAGNSIYSFRTRLSPPSPHHHHPFSCLRPRTS